MDLLHCGYFLYVLCFKCEMMHFGKANKGSIDEQKDLGVEVYICLQLVARGKGGEEGIWDVCFQSHGRT